MLDKRLITSLGAFCLILLLNSNPLPAQTVSIQTGTPSDSSAAGFARIERTLVNAHPSLFRQPMPVNEVIHQLRRLGLPIVLDQSAQDDSLDYQENLTLPLPYEPLGVRLRHALAEHNAALCITDGLLRIISLDDAGTDPRFLTTLVYDVTSLGGTPDGLINTIQITVQSESWMNTGPGLGSISAIRVGRRNLLVVTQGYLEHREVHRLLKDLHSSGGLDTRQSLSTYRKRSSAKPVAVPNTQSLDRKIAMAAALPTKQPPTRKKKRVGGGGVF